MRGDCDPLRDGRAVVEALTERDGVEVDESVIEAGALIDMREERLIVAVLRFEVTAVEVTVNEEIRVIDKDDEPE